MELKEAIEILKPLSKLEIYDDRYLLNEPHFDEDCVRALNTVLTELDRQKQVKAEMRKVAWEEGYNQGYYMGVMDSVSGKE